MGGGIDYADKNSRQKRRRGRERERGEVSRREGRGGRALIASLLVERLLELLAEEADGELVELKERVAVVVVDLGRLDALLAVGLGAGGESG